MSEQIEWGTWARYQHKPFKRVAEPEPEEHQTARAAWVEELAELWVSFGKPVDKKRMVAYIEQLGLVPYELLKRAVARTIREHQYNTVPTIGEVWQAVRKELDKDGYNADLDLEAAIDGWTNNKYERARICLVKQ